MKARNRQNASRGSTLVEFSLIAFALMIVIFASIEFDRMILVYTTVANSARAGSRYAIVHGSNRTSIGDPESGPGNTTHVETTVKNFAKAGLLDTDKLEVIVEYPSGNTPGSLVIVRVRYPYDPLTPTLPLRVNLRSRTQGIIVF